MGIHNKTQLKTMEMHNKPQLKTMNLHYKYQLKTMEQHKKELHKKPLHETLGISFKSLICLKAAIYIKTNLEAGSVTIYDPFTGDDTTTAPPRD